MKNGGVGSDYSTTLWFWCDGADGATLPLVGAKNLTFIVGGGEAVGLIITISCACPIVSVVAITL